MGHFDAYIEKKYGHYLIKDILLTMIFVMVFIVVLVLLKPYWDTDDDSILTKVGAITSITGVFLGTYIALWLIIRSKTKKIEENYFYKISFLVNVQGMLSSIQQMNSNLKVEEKFGTADIEKIENIRKSLYEDFEYWKNQLEKNNLNTSVPADVFNHLRTAIDLSIQGQFGFKKIFPVSQFITDAEKYNFPFPSPILIRTILSEGNSRLHEGKISTEFDAKNSIQIVQNFMDELAKMKVSQEQIDDFKKKSKSAT